MRETGATGLSTVLIIIAIAMIGGFLAWLYRSSSELRESVTPVLVDDSAIETIDLAMLSADPDAAVGQTAALDSIAVVQSLGRGVFVVQLAGDAQYPVLMGPDIIQRNTRLYGGDVVRLYGRVYSLNDSIRSEWVSRGAVDSNVANTIPEIGSFVLADSLEVY